jgi:carbonic anhydrase
VLTFTGEEFAAQLEAETAKKPTWAAEAFDDLEQDVRRSIARVKASPFVARKDSVRGLVYEVETGRLREVT